ncbi:hypothetical protein [Syntrophotalea acetylenica]|uniref:hypothetical protein n=1 Tax=Syntrophotalea acetylenica TaxID=29542 RepID=UPI000A489D0D|nr:hypothetical protein [Syntrophotalea acetylenica]
MAGLQPTRTGTPRLVGYLPCYIVQGIGPVAPVAGEDVSESAAGGSYPLSERPLLWVGVGLFIGIAILASLAVHAVEKRYWRAAVLIPAGFMLAFLIFYFFAAQSLTLAQIILSLLAKGGVTLITALLVGLPFKIYRSRKATVV